MKPFLYKFLLFTICSTPIINHAQTIKSPKIEITQSTDKTIAKIVYFDLKGNIVNKPKSKAEGFYRKFLGQTAEGWYVVQNFYQKNNQKQSDPFLIKEKSELQIWHTSPVEGSYIFWYKNGKKANEANYKDGKREGLSSLWYKNGQKWTEEHYKDGKSEGVVLAWYPDGQKWSESNYKDGKQDGISTEWRDSGQKKAEEHFKNGQLEGLSTIWYKNGQKRTEENYQDGKLEGLTTTWYEDGQKQNEGSYKDDERDGIWIRWFLEGSIEKVHYKNGVFMENHYIDK